LSRISRQTRPKLRPNSDPQHVGPPNANDGCCKATLPGRQEHPSSACLAGEPRGHVERTAQLIGADGPAREQPTPTPRGIRPEAGSRTALGGAAGGRAGSRHHLPCEMDFKRVGKWKLGLPWPGMGGGQWAGPGRPRGEGRGARWQLCRGRPPRRRDAENPQPVRHGGANRGTEGAPDPVITLRSQARAVSGARPRPRRTANATCSRATPRPPTGARHARPPALRPTLAAPPRPSAPTARARCQARAPISESCGSIRVPLALPTFTRRQGPPLHRLGQGSGLWGFSESVSAVS
jgi:hypothetical protein